MIFSITARCLTKFPHFAMALFFAIEPQDPKLDTNELALDRVNHHEAAERKKTETSDQKLCVISTAVI